MLRTVSGAIAERWFFERLVNMTYSPKNKVRGIIFVHCMDNYLLPGVVSVAAEWWADPATQILHKEMQGPVLLYQGGNGEGGG